MAGTETSDEQAVLELGAHLKGIDRCVRAEWLRAEHLAWLVLIPREDENDVSHAALGNRSFFAERHRVDDMLVGLERDSVGDSFALG